MSVFSSSYLESTMDETLSRKRLGSMLGWGIGGRSAQIESAGRGKSN